MPTIYLPKKPKQKRLKHSDKRDNLNNKFVYNTNTWRNLRLEYLKHNPLCKECFKKNILTSAVEVHHIIPISSQSDILKKQELGFDYKNLKGLCKECHKLEHK